VQIGHQTLKHRKLRLLKRIYRGFVQLLLLAMQDLLRTALNVFRVVQSHPDCAKLLINLTGASRAAHSG